MEVRCIENKLECGELCSLRSPYHTRARTQTSGTAESRTMRSGAVQGLDRFACGQQNDDDDQNEDDEHDETGARSQYPPPSRSQCTPPSATRTVISA